VREYLRERDMLTIGLRRLNKCGDYIRIRGIIGRGYNHEHFSSNELKQNIM
jgi:hypothetical protein